MKKLFPAAVLCLVVVVGAMALYLFQKQGRGNATAGEVAGFLPADTQLLLSIPDLNGALADWKTTDLYKIWTEPEMQAFLARPLSRLPQHREFDEMASKILHLSPSNLFLAVCLPNEETNLPRMLAGFDFKADKAEVEQLLSGAKDALRRRYPAGKADLVEYQGHSIESFDGGNGNFFAAAYLENRYLLANNLPLLKATIDRCDHRAPAANSIGRLDQEADFQAVLAKLPPQHATLIFARPQAAFRRLFDLATAAGQPIDDARLADLEKVKALGATTRIENGKLRDSVYLLAPGATHVIPKLAMGSLPLTSPSTLIYAAALFELPPEINLPGGPLPPGTPASGLLMSIQELAAMLHDHNVTLARFAKAFGNEFSLHLDWPSGQAQPALLLTVDVRDSALAGKFVDDLTNTLSAEAAWEVSQSGGLTFHTMSAAKGSFISPTLTVTNKHLIFGLNPPEVREAAERELSGGENFTGNEVYRKTVGQVATPNAAFLYIDSPAFFERLYGTIRSFAMLGSFFYPQVNEYLDLTKLPATKTVSKHLSPTVFSQKTDDQGSLLESIGSVTAGQVGFVLVGGTAVATIPFAQSQFSGPARAIIPAPAATASPSPVPEASPADVRRFPSSERGENQ